MSGDPLRPAPPRLRSPLGWMSGDPLRPAPPRLRSPLGWMSGDPLRPAPPRLRSPLVDRQIHPVAVLGELGRLLRHALVQRRLDGFLAVESVLGGVRAHIRGYPHRAELRPAHRAEVRGLRGL